MSPISKSKDTQRSAVYKWERRVAKEEGVPSFGNRLLTLPQCEVLIRRIWGDYCSPLIPPPRIADGRGTRHPRGCAAWVNLPVRGRSPIVVVHEVTHALQDIASIWPDRTERRPGHGRGFAALFLDLLSSYLHFDSVRMRRMGIDQKPRRVHFAPLRSIPAPLEGKRRVLPAEIRGVLDRLIEEQRGYDGMVAATSLNPNLKTK